MKYEGYCFSFLNEYIIAYFVYQELSYMGEGKLMLDGCISGAWCLSEGFGLRMMRILFSVVQKEKKKSILMNMNRINKCRTAILWNFFSKCLNVK
jgi:hypothetical protein